MTMQPNDRELLKWAAKAAGYELGWDIRGAFVLPAGVSGSDTLWNPLTDDGDALRLAVKLHLPMDFYDANVDPEYQEVRIGYGAGPLLISETLSADPYAAIRRAIVRAAAEIGRSRT